MMSPRSMAWFRVALGGLLLGREASGLYLTLANFQSVTTLSLPLECVFAYNIPMQGCRVEDFSDGQVCSSSCRQRVARIQTVVQQACATVSAGERSLLNEALEGNLVVALCGNGQPPSGSTLTTLTTTSMTGRDDGFLASATHTPLFAPTSASESATTSTTSTAEPHGAATTTTVIPQPPRVSISLLSLSLSSSTSRPAAETQPRGGGGSPFDPVPVSAARPDNPHDAAWLFAAGSCVVGTWLLLY